MTQHVTEAKLGEMCKGIFDMICALKESSQLSSDRQHELNMSFSDSFEAVLTRLGSIFDQSVRLQNRVTHLESELEHLGSKSCASCTDFRKSPSHRNANSNKSTKIEKPVVRSRLKARASHAPPEPAPRVKTASSDDACEVLISGVPLSPNLHRQRTQMVYRLLTFASLSNIVSQVVSTRSWKAAVSTVTKSANTALKPSAFVVKFASPNARDVFVNKINKLNYLNSQNVFGTKESIGIKINAINLLPKPTFLLLMKARKLYKSIGYAPPVVKRGIVYMRKSCQAPLSAIYSEADLTRFTSA